jgi:uncharacterized protein YndB with AHSA1/START domain
MKILHTIDILRPPEDVFLWIGSPERAMVWMTSVSKTEFLHRTPNMIGTTFRETVADDEGSTELQGVVRDYRPNQRIAFHLSGPYNVVDVEYRLETIEGGTRLTQTADVRFKSFLWLMSIVMGPMFKKKLVEQVRREFANLKELCERGATPKA